MAKPAEKQIEIDALEASLRDDPDGVLNVTVDGVSTTFEKSSEKIARLRYLRDRLSREQRRRRFVRSVNLSGGGPL